MHVYPYDLNKNVLTVDLPIKEIVDAGIDPFAVDLFDEKPVVRMVPQWGNFKRLTDFSFAYIKNNVGYIGTHDEDLGRCTFGEVANSSWTRLTIKNVRPCPAGFKAHMREYLGLVEPRLRMFDVSETPRQVWWPDRTEAVSLDRGQITWQQPGDRWGNVRFVKRTFERFTLPLKMPEPILRIFETFHKWRPIVAGEALLDALLGRTPDAVDFFLDVAGSTSRSGAVEDKLRSLPVINLRSEHAHKRVCFRLEKTDYRLREGWSHPDGWLGCDFSANQLISRQPDRVEATRIALYDIARKQFRLASNMYCDQNEMETWKGAHRRLAARRLRFVQTPFRRWQP